ncbi:MAG TPA: hypothetical protein VIK72_04370 [Clostridiaceae bacterium]
MNKNDIQRVIGKLAPDKEMEHRLSKKILQKRHYPLAFKPIISIAASITIVFCLGILGHNLLGKKSTSLSFSSSSTSVSPKDSTNSISSSDGLYIPKIVLPKNTNAAMDMIGLIVYQSRVYTQTGTKISPEGAKNLLGEKLGTTKGNIDEWSQQKDYAVEFASSIGILDVYMVKGYDKNFRIMTYGKFDGIIDAQVYECFNGISVKTGADIFNKLKIGNNIKTVKYESSESWNSNKQQYKELTDLNVLTSFVAQLKNTTPYSQESLSYLFEEKVETNQKFIYITLNDGCQVQLRLFKDGYIYYDFSHIFFKMDNQAFKELWSELD